MLKKLRVRFICINMAIVLVMLSVIFGMVLHFTRQSLAQESISMMQSVAADPMQLNWPGTSSSRLPYFTARISPFGTRISGTSYYDLSDAELAERIINLALEKDGDTGYLPDYNLRYYRTWQHGDEFIIFADVSSEEATMRSLLRLSVIIGLASLGGFFLISLLLARWAVKPVDKAWTQQRQFVSDASHELKTPLTVILTNAELLQDPDYSPEDRSRFSENILTMAHQMRGLVEGLLDLARVDNGAVRQAFREIDLSALVQEAVLPFEPVFYEKDLTLETSVEEGIKCKGSQRHLRQTVEILLDNAQKYADPGAVTLKLEKQGHSHCLLSVATPGTPLTPEECKNIFKRFYRADKARSSDGSYGLGLAIAESIVRDHSGKIWCEGTPGKNTFYVQLPRENS